MAREDAAAVSQIMGCCESNGKPGLGLFYVEKYCKHRKNSLSDFDGSTDFSNEDLMNGLAVTRVCLRIALPLSNFCVHL